MDSGANNQVSGLFSEAQVSRLTGLSVRQLRLWAKSDFFRATIDPRRDPAYTIALYDFRELACLRVIGLLRKKHGVSLQELRRTKERLSHMGPDIWARTTLYVLRKRVVIVNPQTGNREEVTSGQGVLSIPLRVVTGELEKEARLLRDRDPASIGLIEQKRGLANNRPVIAGTRVLVTTILSWLEEGFDHAEILKQFPVLTEKDISAVIDFKETA